MGVNNTVAADEHGIDPSYAIKVGNRLRAIRKQKRLSLQEVEATSRAEFKASVLGAYERGERAISVPRLQRLSSFYRVPVDQLLPRPAGDAHTVDLADGAILPPSTLSGDGPVTIDLMRLAALQTPEAELLGRYLAMIQVQRGDFNGRMLTIRRDDLRAVACLLDITPDAARGRLDELDLRLTP